MYEKVSTNLNFIEREKKILDFWNSNKIFEKSIDIREGGEQYTVYDGPPTANGKPHIGHVLTRVIKDIIPRYRTTYFNHIWASGYSAGYYSYIWAEVLDADAFEAFKEHGIFNKEIAAKFRNNILSQGGTEDPMKLYVKFRGKQPEIKPLLEKRGLN